MLGVLAYLPVFVYTHIVKYLANVSVPNETVHSSTSTDFARAMFTVWGETSINQLFISLCFNGRWNEFCAPFSRL